MRLSLLILLLLHTTAYAGWLDRKAEGWAWYEDQKKAERREEKKVIPTVPSEDLSKRKKELEDKLAAAILSPTHENVLAYLQEQQKWLNLSTEFSQKWSQLLLRHPSLDHTTQVPVSQYGLQLYTQAQQEKQERLFRALTEDYGLFFFYEGNQLSSKVFAEVVDEFSKKYNWKTVAISVDGKFLEGFSESREDNGISKKFELTVFPALLLVNPKENTVTPVSFGLVSVDQIEHNIFLQLGQGVTHD